MSVPAVSLVEIRSAGKMQKPLKPHISDVRTKGQVWTPRWVAEAMAAYLSKLSSESLLDPAVGPGVLLSAAEQFSGTLSQVTAFEIDETVLANSDSDTSFARARIAHLRLKDFIHDDSEFKVSAVISNPPYLRHHRIPAETKLRCQQIVSETLGITIDARAGLHVYFLVKALSHLKPGGRLSFLVPADTFEGVFAKKLWKAISEKFQVYAVLTFGIESAAFPGVDTNASVVFIERSKPSDELLWLEWRGQQPEQLGKSVEQALSSDFATAQDQGLQVKRMNLGDAIQIGFSRLNTTQPQEGKSLNEFASMMRGVASGSNEFFLMTRKRLEELGLRKEYFVRTIPRVRDASVPSISEEFLDQLDLAGRPTYLLSLDQDSVVDEALQKYLDLGEASGIANGALVSTRKRWFYMEKRKPVPILFAYLGRRNNRFIEAKTELTPLTGFLCVYPKPGVDVTKLLKALNHPDSINELSRIGKTYGDGAIKVEPGGLRNMIIPKSALEASGL